MARRTGPPVRLDNRDRTLINHAQGGFPLTRRPFKDLGDRIGMPEEEVLQRLQRLQADGAIDRFAPILDSRGLGGNRTLAAIAVPEDRFDEVTQLVNAHPEVVHNYRREHRFNMWFVISSDDESRIARVIQDIEAETGLPVLNLPTLEEYFVELLLELPLEPEDAHAH